MTDPLPMCLVFRLGGIGFAIPVGMVEEILAEGDALLCGETGGLNYRGVTIPPCDLAGHFGLPPGNGTTGPMLVLKGRDLPQAVAVDKVEGVFPGGQFQSHPVPPLLSLHQSLPYAQLALWRDEPLVYCDQASLADLAGGL